MALGHDQLLRKLKSTTELTAEATAAVRGVTLLPRRVESGVEVVREGDRPSDCCLVVEGLLVRQKSDESGRRQIMSIHPPGDFVDLQSLYLRVMDHSVATLTASTVAFVSHAEVRDLMRRIPVLAEAFWRDALVDAAIHREWIRNVGARPAYQRMAHLLCEIFLKMSVVGLTEDDHCDFPLSQSDLADCTGLSSVHVNRTLQQLRADGLIQLSHRRLTIPDSEALEAVGGFDPSYLHLRPQAA